MATKSIIKDVVIRDPKLSRKFIVALEQAENKHCIPVKMKKRVNIVDSDQVKLLFTGEEVNNYSARMQK